MVGKMSINWIESILVESGYRYKWIGMLKSFDISLVLVTIKNAVTGQPELAAYIRNVIWISYLYGIR